MDPYKIFRDDCDTRWHEEKRTENFCHCENSFVFEMFASIDLLGSKGMFISFAQKLLKYIVGPYHLSLDICDVR